MTRGARLLAIGLVLAAVGAAAVLVAQRRAAESELVLGMVRRTEIRIAAETTGRLESFAVEPGQKVQRGQVLAVISNPELAASVEEARAGLASARAERDRIYSGVRPEEVSIAAQAVRTAEANVTLSQSQFQRISDLAFKAVASRQQLDESTASLAKAQAVLDQRRAEYAAASAGPIAQERALADAKVRLAEATLTVLEAYLQKTTLRSPADGVMAIQVLKPGEAVVPAKPVAVIELDGEFWFGFTLREDALGSLVIGSNVTLLAADSQPIAAQVSELRPLGEFATWRAARAVGDHDINSFRLRLDPMNRVEGLEPGMSVWLKTEK